MKPVVRDWTVGGCISAAYGVIAMIWALVDGPRAVESGIVYCVVFAGCYGFISIRPWLRQIEAPAVAPAEVVVQTTGRAARVYALSAVSVAALLGACAAFVPDAMFRLGLLGLLTGAIWLIAALVVRRREVSRLHGQVVAGARASRLKPWTTSFYVIPSG
jgi:hypothetical protein